MLCHAKQTTITDLIVWGQNELAAHLPQWQVERVETRDLNDIQPVIFWGRFGALATVERASVPANFSSMRTDFYSCVIAVFREAATLGTGRRDLRPLEVGGACSAKNPPWAQKLADLAQPEAYSAHCLYTETDLHTRQILNFGNPPKCSALGVWCQRPCRRRRRKRLREVCASVYQVPKVR